MNPRRLLVLPPVAIGAVVLVLAVQGREGPQVKPVEEAARRLRVIKTPELRLVPSVEGYGTARPARIWRAVAEVAGTLTAVHPEVRPGGMLRAGTVVAEIDSSTYALTARRLEVEIEQVQAQLVELEAQAVNLKASRGIEEASLALSERDLGRLNELYAGKTASVREVDEARRGVLVQRQSLQAIVSQLNLLPAQEASLEASLGVKRVNLEQARIDLGKAVLRAPFDCRVGDVELEAGQIVKAYEQLFEGSGIQRVEIEAQVLLDQARNLFETPSEERGDEATISLAEVLRRMNLGATVRFSAGPLVAASWEGEVVRIREAVNQETRTVTFVVAVDDPFGKAIPGKRPPLVSGMFCEVELRNSPRPPGIVIPMAALHEDSVYVVDAEHRLRRRAVEIDMTQGDLVRLRTGLAAGETLVVSDPTPAVEGMLVAPTEDAELTARILEQSSGGGR